MSDDCATWRHQSDASPPVNGFDETSRNGRAPREASCATNAATLARYCVVVGVHGVGTDAPNSSFSATSGWSHADHCAAAANSLSAAGAIASALAGADGE